MLTGGYSKREILDPQTACLGQHDGEEIEHGLG